MKQTFTVVLFVLFGAFTAYSQSLIHYWNFNNNASEAELLLPTVSAVPGASITHNAGGISVINFAGGTGQNFAVQNLNNRFSDSAGAHLRFNNPIGGELVFALPTTGHRDVVVMFATRRSGSGAGLQYWAYSTDGGTNFTSFDTILPNNGDPGLVTFDFAGVAAINNNPNFLLRVTFAEGTGGTVGNNRFDNLTLDGFTLAGQAPPVHYWNFNNNASLAALLAPSTSTIPGGAIAHIPGGTSVIDVAGGTGQNFNVQNLNARFGDTAGTHLRFNNPIGGELEFSLPTTGYRNAVVTFATRRSGSGAGLQFWSYSVDAGTTFIPFDTVVVLSADPELVTFGFTGVAGVNDNAGFMLRVAFAEGTGGMGGNNRFDNLTLDADLLIADRPLVHYWNFNDNSTQAALLTPTVANVSGAAIAHIPGGISAIDVAGGTGQNFDAENLNARMGDSAGSHLRFNDPIGGELEFWLPITGFKNPVVKFATRRSGSGAGLQYWSYSVDAGSTFVPFDTIEPNNGNPTLQTLDFNNVTGTMDNAGFRLRVAFAQGNGGTVGNNRFDNLTLEADSTIRVSGIEVSPASVTLNSGGTEMLVATVLPTNADNKGVTWVTTDATVATVDAQGEVTATGAGMAYIIATTDDGGFSDTAEVTVAAPTDLIYYWHFNNFFPPADVTVIEADFTLIPGVTGRFQYTNPIAGERDIDRYSPGTSLNAWMGENPGGSARVRNPSVNRSLVFEVPTTGAKDIVLTQAIQRSGQGMLKNIIEYSVDGGSTWTDAGLVDNIKDVVGAEEWQVHSYDFTGITGVDDNPWFRIRITWDGNNTASNGNNRYDNISLTGDASRVSVQQYDQAKAMFQLYPNPTTGHVVLVTDQPEKMGIITVLDALGRVVLETNNNQRTLDLGANGKGVYFVVAQIDGRSYTQKLVVH